MKKKNYLSVENNIHSGIFLIRNINTFCKKNYLLNIFKNFGNVEFIKIVQKKKSSKYVIMVKFNLPECAIRAACYLDGKIFFQTILHIFNKKDKMKEKIKKFNFKIFKKIRSECIFKKMLYGKNWSSVLISEDTVIKKIFFSLGYIKNKNFSEIGFGDHFISQAKIQNEAFLVLKKEGLNLLSFDPKLMNYKSSKTLLIKNLSTYKKKNLSKIIVNLGKIKKYTIIISTQVIIVEFKKKSLAHKAYSFLKKNENEKTTTVNWAPFRCYFNLKKYQKIPKMTKNQTYKILLHNLPFEINFTNFKKIIVHRCKPIFIKIPKKKSGNIRGFGFLEFSCLKTLKKAFILIQNMHFKKRRISCSILCR